MCVKNIFDYVVRRLLDMTWPLGSYSFFAAVIIIVVIIISSSSSKAGAF
jgi:hypothetical protein